MRKCICVCGLVAAALLLVATPALASIVVKVVDQAGNAVPNVALTAYDVNGDLLAKLGGQESNVFSIPGGLGDKVSFDVGSQEMGWHFGIEKKATLAGITIVLQAAPPANDLCVDAIPVDVGGATSGSTAEATVDTAPSCNFVSVTAPGVWHTVAGTGTTLTVSLAGSDYDTKLSAYCGGCDVLSCITANDDFSGLTSQVSFCSQAGADYNILVHGYSAATGNYQLTVTDSGVGCTPTVECLPPVPTGACCNCLAPPFNCGDGTEADCAAIGGDYLGDDSTCEVFGPSLPEYVSTPGVSFADNTTVTDTITVTDDIVVGDVDVDLIVTHTWVADLDITLTGPDGTIVPIWMDFCGSNDDIDAIFDDEGDPVLCGNPTTGVIDPTTTGGGDLGAFEGTSALGDWTLAIGDDAAGDTGTWVQWSLHFREPGVPACPGPSVCGNGVIEAGEDCDDGNTVDGDGCSALCHNECTTTDETDDYDTDEGTDDPTPGH